MHSKKKYRNDSEPLPKSSKLFYKDSSGQHDSLSNQQTVPITIQAEELQNSITSSFREIKERIISEIDLDSDSARQTESSKEQLKASINSIASNSKHIKVKQKNEKNFKDLNKSLANLASRRVLGRSSSDNDAMSYINVENASKSQFNFEFQVTKANSPQIKLQTPSLGSKQEKNFLTSMKKDNDMTPISFYDRKNGRNYSNMDRYKKELGLSDLDYRKFQKGAYHRENRPQHQSQAILYRPIKTESENYRRNSDWEQMSTARFRKPEYNLRTDAPEIDLSDYESFYEKETFNQRMRGLNLDSDTKHQIIEMQYPEEESKESKESTKNNTPSFKTMLKFQNTLKEHPIRRVDDQSNRLIRNHHTLPNHYEDADRQDTMIENDHYEKLQLNNISDGVEYIQGGLGFKGSSYKKSTQSRGFSGSEDYGFISSRKFGKERLSGVQRETLDSWRHDIIKIKQDIERRQISYDELNRFTRMLDDSPRNSKNQFMSGMNPGESYGGYSEKSDHYINVSKIEKNDHTTSNTPTLGSPSQAQLSQHTQNDKPEKRHLKDKRISFEFKTTDANDDGNAKSPLETRGDQGKQKVKGSYTEATEVEEGPASFRFTGVTYVEKHGEKAPCCGGSSLNCNIF